jgi:hypothetical protein
MYLAVQLLLVSYGKAGRGRGPAVPVPHALPLPPLDGRGVLHECFLSHQRGFEPQSSVVEVPINPAGVVAIKGDLCIRIVGDHAQIAPHVPAEPWRSSPLVVIAAGTWARVLVDEFFVAGEHRWSRELIVNAGMFSAAPPPDVFLGTPGQVVDARATTTP